MTIDGYYHLSEMLLQQVHHLKVAVDVLIGISTSNSAACLGCKLLYLAFLIVLVKVRMKEGIFLKNLPGIQVSIVYRS